MKPHPTLRTWIEISQENLYHNVAEFKQLLKRRTRFGAVIKSNAYGHGLLTTANLLKDRVDWFLVDTFIEGLHLRKEGITNPILVLGYTLPTHFEAAAANRISLTISQFENLKYVSECVHPPKIHLKFDTGMHRQGFYEGQIPDIKFFLKKNVLVEGVYTHFASAKDFNYPHYTQRQHDAFLNVTKEFNKGKFPGILHHAAASGGTIVFPKSHFDMVRVGMGLYGYYPSPEIRSQMQTIAPQKISLRPVLSWKTIVSEVKEVDADRPIGYDLTEYVSKRTRVAILPVGYWHGFDRGLSSVGEVLIRGKRSRVLGRVSMDMIAVEASARVLDVVTILGVDGVSRLYADELARKIGTTQYEFLTRINPLIERIVV